MFRQLRALRAVIADFAAAWRTREMLAAFMTGALLRWGVLLPCSAPILGDFAAIGIAGDVIDATTPSLMSACRNRPCADRRKCGMPGKYTHRGRPPLRKRNISPSTSASRASAAVSERVPASKLTNTGHGR